jgi:transglutaminase-like putative cysteine protease
VSIHVALNHVTHYRYDRPILLSPQVVRLRPAPHTRTPILSYSLRVTPAGHFINWQQDPQSNYLARLVFPEPTRELRIEVDLIAEMSVINPFDFFLEPTAEKIPFGYDEEQTRELFPYLVTLPLTRANAPKFTRWVDDARTLFGSSGKPSVDYLVALIQQMQGDIRYLIRMEPGVQTPEETLQKGSGSCRDTTWLLVQVLRHLGLAARFVSGYLIQLTADVKSLDGPSGPEADFTDLHAWCEVYLPGAGWVGLDATSGLFAGEGHIPLACSPDPSSAAPISGLTEKCETEFEHHMKVERVWEAPRVTKPYTDDAWSRIESLGHRIDVDLVQHDVRLTMGGEPTFVSVDDRDGPEWNTTADSPPDKPVKRLLGAELLAKLKARYAPGGLLHYGQGKWYPGEQLPRWSLSCFWRRDGEPIWHEPALFADEAIDYALTAEDAARFLGALAKRLKVDAGHVFPAFEDVWYYLWRERQLPVNVDPFDARLEDPLERERLRRLFHAGLDSAVGQVLPLARTPKGDAWQSGPWYLRSERCFLIPGDSPMGYRLPLDSQPWVSAAEFPWVHAPDPVQKVVPLRAPKDIAVKVQTPEPEDTGIDFASGFGCRRTPAARARSARRKRSNRPRGSPAPRCARRCVTASCICSCRRCPRWTTTSNW